MAVLNPSSVVVEDVEVDNANPCPATVVAAGSPGADVIVNPRTLLANGAEVSADNPFPLLVS